MDSSPATTSAKEDADAPEEDIAELDGDYYYTKALSYLAESSSPADGNNDSFSSSCPRCSSSPDEPHDDHFSLGLRRGLTGDHADDVHSSGSSSSICSPRESEALGGGNRQRSGSTDSQISSPSSSSPPKRWERKCSIGGRFYNTESSEFGKIEPKRKLSDGHVHWADEFQKELTRCHPRKTYSRHPSHQSLQVKPILKLSHDEDCEQC